MSPQSKQYRLFSLLGFPIYTQASVLILLVIYLFLGASAGPQGTIRALLFCVVAFASIVVHELGHALMVRRLGYGESVIILHGLGGLTQWRGNPNRLHRILISLAGPGAGLLLGVLTLIPVLIFGLPTELISGSLLEAMLWVNLGWSVMNLLPVWPLDGGQVMRSVLDSRRRSKVETEQLSLKVSMITCGGVVALAFASSFIFAAVLFGMLLWSNYNEWKRSQGPPASFYGY